MGADCSGPGAVWHERPGLALPLQLATGAGEEAARRPRNRAGVASRIFAHGTRSATRGIQAARL
ncbi:uncharacterized protein STAUR_2343 [Stigmatella aurantiaca DW4/3-1]|uniref:Uncharacterized protein n=1 Tax=Stigmatella aurantiaca (strain DW4/3-1) TaxID=378806 RepID=E3FEW6_STIAD|nr:uncharacterized protein STAUR_2343 [Stigmatella aurantiaca DW4/3-1]